MSRRVPAPLLALTLPLALVLGLVAGPGAAADELPSPQPTSTESATPDTDSGTTSSDLGSGAEAEEPESAAEEDGGDVVDEGDHESREAELRGDAPVDEPSLVPHGTDVADPDEPTLGTGNATLRVATPIPLSEGFTSGSPLALSAAAEGDDAYPVDLPPGYTRAPFTVQALSVSHPGGTSGGQLVCVMVDRQYVVDITPVPPELRPGVADPIAGFIYYSIAGQPTSAQRTAVSNSVGGSDLSPGYTWIDLGDQVCKSVSYNDPTGDQFDWSTAPEMPDPWASEEAWNAYYLALARAKASQVVVWWNGSNLAPNADFTWELTDVAEREVTFTNTSADAGQNVEDLDAAWDFGDGTQSTATHPVHSYSEPGLYTVTLTMTDDFGASDTVAKQVAVSSGLVVNSTGDSPAEDPEAGCHTGDTVGPDDAPECTLRAAIEAANAAGGGEISFDIEGSPVIALGSPLPAVTTSTTIDATTQSGGWVEVVGGGESVIRISGGTVTLSGLALHGGSSAVEVTGGSDHVLAGLRVGTNLAGAATDDTAIGVVASGVDGLAVRDSTIAAGYGMMLVGLTGEVAIEDNAIGVTPGGAVLGDVEIGILVFGAPAQVRDNVIRSSDHGVMLVAAESAGSTISGNQVGRSGATVFPGVGAGIVVEGVPDAVVTGNSVHAGSWGGIMIAGGVMVEDAGGELVLHSPSETEYEAPVTGVGVTVTDNIVSVTAGRPAIGSWAGAEALVITGNTVTTGSFGVALDGGSVHLVSANILGADGALLVGSGVRLLDTSGSTVSENTIYAQVNGIDIDGDGSGVTITGNVLTGNPSGPSRGIDISGERTGVSVTDNTVTAAGERGISLDSPGALVAGNVVVESGNGIVAEAEGVIIRDNLIGATSGLGSFPGNTGSGILLNAEEGLVQDNVVVGSGAYGVLLGDGGTARGNRIWDSTQAPLVGSTSAPNLAAALIADTDDQIRTTLLITGLPGTAGTLEVFANDSCDAEGAEARYTLDIIRETRAGRTVQIIQVPSARDYFTITYTDADGNTSDLSACAERTVAPDADGDGSPDPLDELMSAAGDPEVAVIATTDEQLLVAVAESGRLEGFAIVDDPAPSGHPAGWALPYGAFSFRVAGLEPGASTKVVLTTYFHDQAIEGNQYWKYGPPVPGDAPTWYDFAFDVETQTGAVRASADVPQLGFRVTYTLWLADGARGDADGARNGTIVDPGGPVIAGDAGTPSPSADGEHEATLAASGYDGDVFGAQAGLAAALVLLGAGLLRLRRRRSS